MIYLKLHKRSARNGRCWRWYLPDYASRGAINLGRYRIDFDWRKR